MKGLAIINGKQFIISGAGKNGIDIKLDRFVSGLKIANGYEVYYTMPPFCTKNARVLTLPARWNLERYTQEKLKHNL